MEVLHITAHLGGGAGKAISGLAIGCNSAAERHSILLLEEPEDIRYVQMCRTAGVEVKICKGENWKKYAAEADVLAVSWWQHPLTAKFLCELSDIPCRVMFWSHVNGCVYPYLPGGISELVDQVLFTTPYSMENPCWTDETRESIQAKSALVYGTGNFDPQGIQPKKDYSRRKKFTVGYVGTLNYAKLHPNFFDYCKAAADQIPDIQFLLVGEAVPEIVEDARKHGLEDRITFTGQVEDVSPYLEQMDVFGYLLGKDNYATTENALLEAMASGLPVVAHDNPPERHIIENGVDGYLVRDAAEYAVKLKELSDSAELCRKYGTAARYSVIARYEPQRNRDNFHKCIQTAMKNNKTAKNFRSVFGKTPWDWFLSCTGPDRTRFEECFPVDSGAREQKIKTWLDTCPPIYRGRSKSSIQHFQRYCPEDRHLAYLTGRLREAGGGTPGGQRRPLAEQLPLEMPYLIQIFPAYGCNFRCGYCLHSLPREQHGFISEKSVMDMDLFRKVVDDVKASGGRLRMLRFAAIGEPLLHRDVAEMVAYAKQADIADGVDIVTNGSLLTPELSDALTDAGLTRLRISLEGLSSDAYRRNAGVDLDFCRLVENIRYFYEHCGETKVYVKIIDYMVKRPEDRELFFSTFGPISHTIAIEHLTPTIEEIDYSSLSGGQKNDHPQNGDRLLEAKVCPQPFYMMQINPDGNVVPCCSMRYPEILGNAYQDTVGDIWRGERYNALRRRLLRGTDTAGEVCRKCSLYRYDLHAEDRLDGDAERLLTLYK